MINSRCYEMARSDEVRFLCGSNNSGQVYAKRVREYVVSLMRNVLGQQNSRGEMILNMGVIRKATRLMRTPSFG